MIRSSTASRSAGVTALTLPDGSTVPGLDSRFGPIEEWNGTYSGYYKRKSIDPSVDHQFVSQEVPWIFIRYAEILFNYAEASIELDELDDAVAALNQIRRRAGMPEFPVGMGRAALREEYRNERRVEMAFEEQRYAAIVLQRRSVPVAAADAVPAMLAAARAMGIREQVADVSLPLAVALVVATVVVAPLGAPGAVLAVADPALLGLGFLVALLSSVVPYSLELNALRRLPPAVFSIQSASARVSCSENGSGPPRPGRNRPFES